MTRTRTLSLLAVVAVSGMLSGASAAAGGSRAPTTVTIQAEGTDLSGTVASPRPARCADERRVIVMRQHGSRGGGNDTPFASDTSELQGNQYKWSTGNTGTEGRFYAKVRRTAQCQADTSRTIRAENN